MNFYRGAIYRARTAHSSRPLPSPVPSVILITPSTAAAASVERASAQSSGRSATPHARARARIHPQHIYAHTCLPHDTPCPYARVYPRKVGGGEGTGGLGRRGLSAVGGVIASAQIEYISYVFITTAAALRRPAICHPRRHLSPATAAATATPGEGWRSSRG